MQRLLAEQPGLDLRAGGVEDLVLDGRGSVAGVVRGDGATITAGRVVITTGTFLRGVIHPPVYIRRNVLSTLYSFPIARLRPARSPASASAANRALRLRRHALARHGSEQARCHSRVAVNAPPHASQCRLERV